MDREVKSMGEGGNGGEGREEGEKRVGEGREDREKGNLRSKKRKEGIGGGEGEK